MTVDESYLRCCTNLSMRTILQLLTRIFVSHTDKNIIFPWKLFTDWEWTIRNELLLSARCRLNSRSNFFFILCLAHIAWRGEWAESTDNKRKRGSATANESRFTCDWWPAAESDPYCSWNKLFAKKNKNFFIFHYIFVRVLTTDRWNFPRENKSKLDPVRPNRIGPIRIFYTYTNVANKFWILLFK